MGEKEQKKPIDEELVAYLDGELDEVDNARVEERLSDDESYRVRLKELQQTWDALDVLPRSDASQSFTASTIEMVLSDEQRKRKSATWLLRWSGSIATTAVLLLVGAWIGYILTFNWQNDENRELIDNLTLIENIDMYREVRSIEFLEKLHEADVFPPEVSSE